MSLYRRGRIWWVELQSDSGRVRESSGTADKKEAKKFHERRKIEIWRQDRLGEAKPVTWAEAVKAWLSVKPRGLPDRYRIQSFGLGLTEALPLSGERITKLLKGNLTAGSHNRSLALLLSIHRCSGLTPPTVDRKPMPPGRTRWLTAEQWAKFRPILEAESPLLAEAADFTLATGLRENNVLELTWDQVDLRRRLAWLHGDQTKGGEPIGVPLNNAALAVLKARRGLHKQYVFAHPESGKPLYKASNRAWYAALRKAKLVGFRWHDLRHTWASWHVMNGTRIEELQELGAWKDPKMVRRYAHLSKEHLARAAANVKPVSLRYNASKPSGRTHKGTHKGG